MGKKNEGYVIKEGEIKLVPVRPENEDATVWDILWDVYERKNEKRKVGTISFDGPPEHGTIEVRFETEPEFKGHGYAKDALKAITNWAFSQKGIYEITAVAEHENDAAIHVLERAGFVFRGGTREIENYSVKKQKTSWQGFYLALGIALGFALGVLLNNVIVGMVIGVFAGFTIGTSMDTKTNREREEITGEARQKKRKRNSAASEKEEGSSESTEGAGITGDKDVTTGKSGEE